MVNLGKKDLFFRESIGELLLPACQVIDRLEQFLLGRCEPLICRIEIVMSPFSSSSAFLRLVISSNTVYTSEGSA